MQGRQLIDGSFGPPNGPPPHIMRNDAEKVTVQKESALFWYCAQYWYCWLFNLCFED